VDQAARGQAVHEERLMLLNLVPWYIRLGIMALLAVSCFTAGAVEGIKWEEGQAAVAAAKVAAHVQTVVKTVTVENTKIEKVYVDRAAKRAAEKEKIDAETNDHAKLPDPAGCWLAPERVRSINDAWLGSAADTGAGPAGLRSPGAAEVGEPSGSGAVGKGTGLRLPRLLGHAQGTGGEDSPAAKTGGAGQ
jgi:hypothetical protein